MHEHEEYLTGEHPPVLEDHMSEPCNNQSVREAQLTAALQVVLDYLWDEEEAAYRALSPKERRGHIFPSLRVIRRWLDERQS